MWFAWLPSASLLLCSFLAALSNFLLQRWKLLEATCFCSPFQERLEQLQKDRVEADSVRKEKEALKIAVEELENKALEKYRTMEEEVKERQQEEEKKASEQEAFEHFHRLDANQDGK
jgi:hypothetical protein